MQQILVAIDAKLTKPGAKDIDLLVHSYWLGKPSPYVVVTDSMRHIIGGAIDSLDQMFASQVAIHAGYSVKERAHIFAIPPAPPAAHALSDLR